MILEQQRYQILIPLTFFSFLSREKIHMNIKITVGQMHPKKQHRITLIMSLFQHRETCSCFLPAWHSSAGEEQETCTTGTKGRLHIK